jgi:hypothetical protein
MDIEYKCTSPGSGGWENIGTLVDRKKENTIAPTMGGGKDAYERFPTAGPAERFAVLRDEVECLLMVNRMIFKRILFLP